MKSEGTTEQGHIMGGVIASDLFTTRAGFVSAQTVRSNLCQCSLWGFFKISH